jgi:endonuclease/exonuclease/phosphatase family metal-dependent hydrolase
MKIILWNVAMTPNPPPNVNDRDAKNRAPKIAKILNNYDIVILNESFLYRDLLLKHVEHKHRYTDPRVWYKVFNSGVVILSKVPLADVNYKHYSKGAIWDWFVSKALVGCTFKFNGIFFDIYGTHLQAGNQPCAHDARQSQMEEIVQYVSGRKASHELIICGDFNCGPVYDPTYQKHSIHYSSADDARLRARQYNTLLSGLHLTPLLMFKGEDDISSFVHKRRQINYTIKRIQDPDIRDENGVGLSDTGALCLEITPDHIVLASPNVPVA